MNDYHFLCPFCQKRIEGGSLAPVHCPSCNKNLRDSNALLLARFKQSWWFKVSAILCGLVILFQIGVWVWSSIALKLFLFFILVVAIGGYWLNKRQKTKQWPFN